MKKKEPKKSVVDESSPDHHHKAIKHHISMLHKMAKQAHKAKVSKKRRDEY